MKVEPKLLKNDTPIMVVVSLLFILLFWDRHISTVEGLLLLVLILIYTFFTYIRSKRDNDEDVAAIKTVSFLNKYIRTIYLEILLIITSVLFLVLGANFLIDGSIRIAKFVGVSEAVIGLTIVAAGTSLPELATTIIATIHRNQDIAIGNIVGSNIFNILAILGLSSIVSPIDAIGINKVDVFVMTSFSILLLYFMRTNNKLERWEGLFLIAGYIAYVVLLVK